MRARMFPVLLMTAVALAPSAAGCGADHRPSDAEQVRATVTAFARATADKDYARICRDVLATRLVERIQRAGLTCGEVLEAGLGDVRRPRVAVTAVKVEGDTATARVRSDAAGQATSEDTLRLVRERRGWRIASLGR